MSKLVMTREIQEMQNNVKANIVAQLTDEKVQLISIDYSDLGCGPDDNGEMEMVIKFRTCDEVEITD